MNGFLLDTNILSELRKGSRCDSGLRAWMNSAPSGKLYVSVVAFGEMRRGIELMRIHDANQARILERWLEGLLDEFADSLLPIDERVSDAWGRLGLKQPVPILDALMAATAIVYDLTVVSRDETGFRNTGARMINPFAKL